MCSYFDINKSFNVHTCCACLEIKSDECVPLQENCDLSELYEFCVGIPVTCADVPQLLCNRCVNIIKEYAHFKKQCRASYELWKSLFNQEKYSKENCTAFDVKEENESADDAFNESNSLQKEYLNNVVSKRFKDGENGLKQVYTDIKGTEYATGYKKDKKIDYKNVNVTYVQESDDSFEKEGLVKVLECSKCNKQYQKTKCLIKHMTQSCYKHVDTNKLIVVKKYRPSNAKANTAPSELYCGLCDYSSSIRDNIKTHLHEHWNNNDLRCKLCSYAGKDLAELIGHRSVHQPYEFFSKLDNRCCHICDKRCVTTMMLQFHYRSVHLNKNGGLCSVCRKAFKCYTAWRNHERLHKGGGRYICDLCGNKFLFRHQIKTHLADHSNIRSSICDVCGKGFKRASYLKEHLNTVHVVQPVKCPHCDKTFKSPANLKDHLKQVSKSRHYQCEVCSKRFPSAASLKSHAFWHTGERPFACESCGARYKAKAQLKIHMRKHTGQRPYRCPQCDKCFPTLVQLKRHGSVHTGDRPYKCTACSRSFHYKKLLLMHCAAKHGRVKIEADARVA